MGIDYVLLAGLALYFLMIKVSASTNLRPIVASLIVVLGYFIFSTFIRGMILNAYDAPLWQLFGIAPLTTLIMQLAIAIFVFIKLDQESEESYGSWMLWGVVGCIGIFFVAPQIAAGVFGRF